MHDTKVLEYENIPQVAMEAMNGVHKDELAIVNSVYSAIVDNDINKISTLCEQWLAHTKAHFERENSMMEKYGFPAYACHHGEHTDALITLKAIIQHWNNTNSLEELKSYVSDTWPQWYVNHISTMDTVTSAFIKQSMSNE